LILAWFQRRGWFRGQLIKLYIIAYLIYRIITEWIRPEARLALDLTGYQWACLALIPVFVAIGMIDAKRSVQRPPSGPELSRSIPDSRI
jgi:prolipoprotein diacylglyceryltransferase